MSAYFAGMISACRRKIRAATADMMWQFRKRGLKMRVRTILLLIVLQVFLLQVPAMAAPFDPVNVKIYVNDSLWQQYQVGNPTTVYGDVVKVYKVKKLEVALQAGDKIFGSHTFTPEKSSPAKFSLLPGLSSMKIKLTAFAADDVSWSSTYDLKEVGDTIEIKACTSPFAIYYPGI